MPKKYIYNEDKPKDLPVIHTQFEEEEFEYADGGDIESAAKRMANNPNWTNDKLLAEYKSLTKRLEDFKNGLVTPRKIIGGGYKSSAVAKKVAKQWLEDRIAEYKMALEIRGVMSRGGRTNKDWAGRKSKENWGKQDLDKMYDNNLDLVADVSDYYKNNSEFKDDMIEVLKTGTLKSNDGATLTFAKGGKLVGKQYRLDKNKNGRLDSEDFKMIRGEKAWGGKMADGGMMAKGGDIPKIPTKIINNAKKSSLRDGYEYNIYYNKENKEFSFSRSSMSDFYKEEILVGKTIITRRNGVLNVELKKYEDVKMAHGGMTASQEDHVRDYIVRKFDTEDFYLDVEDGNLLINATQFDEDEREKFLKDLNYDLFNGMGTVGDDYVEGKVEYVSFLTEMVMKQGGRTYVPKHKKKTIAQKAAEMVGYSTWFGLDEETKAGVIADMVTEGLLPQRMAAGAKVASKFSVTYTMLDGTKQSVDYSSKEDMDEGIAAFYMDNDVADLEIKESAPAPAPKKAESEEKPKKKSLFDVATAAPAKTKKDAAPQVQIDGIGDEIERYDELKAIIKNAEAEQEVIGGRIREVAKDKYLEVYEKMGRRPTTIALTDDGKEILFTVQDRYKIVTPEKEEILKSYDNLLGIEVTYKFNNEVLDKENQNGEKIGDVINDLIMNSEDIPDDLKSRLLTVTRKASVKQGTIERLLDYINPAEIFQVIEPITALK